MADLATYGGIDISALATLWGTDVANLYDVAGLTVVHGSVPSYDTITAGADEVFESANSTYISVCMMDATHAIATYQDGGNSSYGTAICLVLDGSTITAGAPTVFESAATSYTSVCRMSATAAIVCYKDGGNSNYGTACCLTLTGDSIEAGTPAVFASSASVMFSVCSMSTTVAVVCYRASSQYGTACGLGLSGAIITPNATPVVFNLNSTLEPSVCAMDATHAIVCFADEGSWVYGTAKCLTLTGTSIAPGNAVVFEYASTQSPVVNSLDSTHAVVSYIDHTAGAYGTACCLVLSGTHISPGSPVVFDTGSCENLCANVIGSGHVVVCYTNYSLSSYSFACVLTLTGTTITYGTPAEFRATDVSYQAVYVDAAVWPPRPVQFVWKNWPLGLSTRSYVCAPK